VNEEAILEKIKENPSNFSAFFKLYYKPIFGYIFRRIGVFDDSADIASETFLKAFQHIHQFTYRGISIKVWLYRIASNEINLHFRNQHKQLSFIDNNLSAEKIIFKKQLEQDKEILERELKQHQQYFQVLEQLKTLPDKYQTVIALRYFEGKDNKEIALILNIKEGTLKSLLSRGVEKLREKCNPF
jgi:RNA polymerase sigma-70 factor, ECF subfamily